MSNVSFKRQTVDEDEVPGPGLASCISPGLARGPCPGLDTALPPGALKRSAYMQRGMTWVGH